MHRPHLAPLEESDHRSVGARPLPGPRRPYDRVKRVLDVVVASVALVVLAPLLLVVAVLIRVSDGGPALFVQTRPGRDGRPYDILKFRSMRPDPELERVGAPGDHLRITPLGALLRRTSIDELPNLLNVLKGEMSVVGPRPHRMDYLPLYSDRQWRRHDVLPGITGLAQVRGRNALDWPTRLELDVEYVQGRSWWLDLKIVLATVRVVLGAEGVSEPGHVSMSLFTGETLPGDPGRVAPRPGRRDVGVAIAREVATAAKELAALERRDERVVA